MTLNIVIYSTLNIDFGGGFERWISEAAPRLVKLGYNVYIITTKAGERYGIKDSSKYDLFKCGVKMLELDNYRRPTIPKLTCLSKLIDVAKEADIIYFNNAFAGNEILMNGVTGFIAPKANADVLANKILTLLSDEELRDNMGRKAYEYAERVFNWQNIVAKWYNLCLKLVRC